jgi:nucleoside-diphosphate-sugar epimerase
VRAFITGASGFIGTHLVNELLRRGWEVRVILHKRGLSSSKQIEAVTGDLADLPGLTASLKDTDVLFHLASALGSSLIPEKEFQTVNAAGTESVLKAAAGSGVKTVIHFSSAGVLGHIPENRPADESYPANPLDAYDRSKLEGERIALGYGRRGLDVRVIRPGWVYGPGDKRTLKLIRAVVRRRILMVSSGLALQSPVFIDDLVEGTFACLERGRAAEVYHLAGPEVLSIKAMIATIARAAGRRPPRLRLPVGLAKAAAWGLDKVFRPFKKEAPLTPSRLAFFLRAKPLDIGKAVRELGYAPRTSFEEGMKATLAWYRENGWL